jgi:ABC-2 type transport system ATP-binding protein
VTHAHADQFPADRSIDIAALRHRYPGGHQALDGVDLTIGTGVFGLLGPNGAGKSTLMRILCTLLEPSEGHVSVCGYDVRRDRRAIRARLGYLPQQFGAWRLHRVEEVLDTLARFSGVREAKTRSTRVAAVLQEVGLGEVAHRKVKTLSGGMVRRLGVAQALVHEPRVLVVDEPTVGLDPQERIRFRQLMSGLGRDRTIVLSTHIVADLGAGCRDLALLDAGQVLFHGAPSDLIRRAAGQVFEATVPLREAEAIEGRHEIVSRSTTGGQVTLRGVAADGRMPPAAVPASDPTLEEAYLAFMASRGRTTSARQKEVAGAGTPAKEIH